ncbi:YidB family protein [Noviherbaspirillum sedimenti]|uniref:DUF937 domain-containing protein n=1 Tax=Noviherbaspirillum sedimenti TaxID=2320865 RepID=A0A3A3G4E0_9BURK|nr:YidB family protein [Noviherbaspirillum sedimenti]RJG02714.1 DUF937 domain-containing protein [Noviherbaspirillum sedimenti]
MGLFDSIAGQLGGMIPGAGNGDSQGGLLEAGMSLLNSQGGLQGLIQTFQEHGLGDTVASWIGTGSNLPISADQIQSVLGSEQVQAIAQKLGLSTAEASGSLATMLPQLIDRLTPDGQLPEGGGMLEQGLNLLKGLGR